MLLGSWTALLHSGGVTPKRGGMLLHVAVMVTCEKGACTKIKAQVQDLKGDIRRLSVSNLTWHDYPSLIVGEILVIL